MNHHVAEYSTGAFDVTDWRRRWIAREDGDNLGGLESPLVVGGVVQDNVWQGVVVWHPLMGKGKTEGGHKESKYKKEETKDSLQRLIREHMLLLQLLGQGDVNLHIRGGGQGRRV